MSPSSQSGGDLLDVLARCTCEYMIDFEDGRGPQHAPVCPLSSVKRVPHEDEVRLRQLLAGAVERVTILEAALLRACTDAFADGEAAAAGYVKLAASGGR